MCKFEIVSKLKKKMNIGGKTKEKNFEEKYLVSCLSDTVPATREHHTGDTNGL